MKTFCTCRSLLYAVNTDSQTIAASGTVNFGTNIINTGRSICHAENSNIVLLHKPGIYSITVVADILADDAGSTVVSLYNGTTAVSGAEATYTAVANTIEHLSFSGLVQVDAGCNCGCSKVVNSNSASLSVQISADAAVSNVAIIVEKVA